MSSRRYDKLLVEAKLIAEYIGDMYAYKYQIKIHTPRGLKIYSGKNAEFEPWRAYANMLEALKKIEKL